MNTIPTAITQYIRQAKAPLRLYWEETARNNYTGELPRWLLMDGMQQIWASIDQTDVEVLTIAIAIRDEYGIEEQYADLDEQLSQLHLTFRERELKDSADFYRLGEAA